MSGFDAFPIADSAPAAAPSAAGSFDAFPVVSADTGDQVSRHPERGAPPSFMEGFAQAWKGETPSSLFRQNMVVRLGDTLTDKAKLSEEAKPEVEAERARREAAGEPADRRTMQRYQNDLVDQRFKATRPQQPQQDQTWTDAAKGAWSAMLNNPGRFAGEMLKGLVVDPELLVQPELGAAKVAAAAGKAAQTVARTAEVATVAGAQGAAISAVRQEQETGQVSGTQVAQEAAVTAAGMAGLHASGQAIGYLARAGLEAAAKRTGGTVSKQVEATFKASMEEDMKTMSPTDALAKNLRDAGLEPSEAQAMADAAKPKEKSDAVDTQGQENQVGNEQGVRGQEGGEGVLRERQQGTDQGSGQGQEGVAPAAEIKPRDVEKLVEHDRPLVDSEEPVAATEGKTTPSVTEPVPERTPADYKRQAELALEQSGKIDPEVLASLGLAGLAGAATYALTGDKPKAVAALALGGMLPFAARIVGKLGKSATDLVKNTWTDTRFPTKQLFRDYFGAVNVGVYAIDTWQRGVEAMLKGEPNLKASWLKIRDATQGHAVTLSPREAAAAGELRKFLDLMGDRGQRADVLHNLIEDYLPGLYQKKPFASWRDLVQALYQNDAFRAEHTGMSPASKHALQKIIPDYRTVDALIAQGKLDLVPLTDNPFEMAAVYAKSLNKTMANKKLIDTLKKTPAPTTSGSGTANLLMPLTTRDAAARIAQSNRILQSQWELPDSAVEMANKFAIMHAPQDYVIVKHPALEGVRVHRDVAGPLKLVLDTSDPGAISKGLYAMSMAAKSALFSFSLFHAGSLAQVGAAQALRRPSFVANLYRANKMRLDTNFHAEVADGLQHGLLPFHNVSDVDPSFFQRAMNLAEKYAGSMPGVGPALQSVVHIPRAAHQAINHFTWEVLHPTLKLASYMTEVKVWAEKNPNAAPADFTAAKRQISTGVNDLYGGINWFELANNIPNDTARTLATALYSPQGKRWQQILLLSPDWMHASLRAWTEGMKAATPGVSAKASDSLYRSYLLMSGLMYLGAADTLQQKYTGQHIWEREDWSVVDMGDGRRIQLNKHFMEGVHLLTDPQKFILNKLNYLPKEVMAQLFDKEYLTHGAGGYGGPTMADTSAGGRVKHAAKNFVSPISFQNLLQDPVSAAAGFFGMPIYGRPYEQQVARARDQAIAADKDPDKAEEKVRKRAAKDAAKRTKQ